VVELGCSSASAAYRAAKLKANGRDAREAVRDLQLFEDRLAIFEDHLKHEAGPQNAISGLPMGPWYTTGLYGEELGGSVWPRSAFGI
jgi:hypothetical protein